MSDWQDNGQNQGWNGFNLQGGEVPPPYAGEQGTAFGSAAARPGASVLRSVYGWMFAGLAISGLVAWKTAESGLWQTVLAGGWFWGLIIGEFVLVMVLSMALNKLSATVAAGLFLGYAALNGLTLSVVFIAYELGAVAKAFFIAAGMFGGAAAYGAVTKRELDGLGSFLGMGLWGVILAGLVNLFFRSPMVDFLVSCAGVIVFTGLAAWDAQKAKQLAQSCEGAPDEVARKLGVLVALSLYLDFVNLFLFVLRFAGGGRRK